MEMGKVVLVVSVRTGRNLRAVVVVMVNTLEVVIIIIEVVVVMVKGYTIVRVVTMAIMVVLIVIGEAWDWEIMRFRGESTWVRWRDMGISGEHWWRFSWHGSDWKGEGLHEM